MNENTVMDVNAVQEVANLDALHQDLIVDGYKKGVKTIIGSVIVAEAVLVGASTLPDAFRWIRKKRAIRKAKKEAAKAKCVDEDGNKVPCDVEE